ncbi:PC11X-like protein [Mya arenaria]|uniref:PC11X-like protein n=1 Tax=Mya arenaria TaxID=6604 RepID=A0ABY7DMV1_MYAAR|nr:protocadherin-7-like [Mya arenaria]XP_052796608.1 protocadherin-7-like [Mya arenaria]XP_052796609.1 protocadherin-7-like [Mya arenaria]XP_052796611.1 protocadherin-7-like [Mya arenaria]XP_052796612.1 protocadherin-7-like [Mya arenaria]XP_052796613.1 protocadherin-7-like [Mya arenaria]XP_052796614.1 protocadherin-7-like [Mya arenaria]WAQ98276.1 PC11X-like protein [Mya arenaria]
MESAQIHSNLKMIFIFLLYLIHFVFSQEDATVTYSVWEEREPKTYIGSVALDSGLFADISNEKFKQLQFQILKSPGNSDVFHFSIETDTSLLWTSDSIDREEFVDCFDECLVEFNVGVFDKDISEMTKIIKIVIDIEDENDNAPKFVNIDSPIFIPESTNTGETIVSGIAIDLDQSWNNSVHMYSISPESDEFELRTVQTDESDREFELVLKTGLDREQTSSYDFVLLAEDGGSPQQTGTFSIQIIVTDNNDNVPTFQRPSYTTTIQENVAVDTTVLELRATDRDADDNGAVSYKFGNRVSTHITDLFSLKSNGDLVTSEIIDFETDQEFSFNVIAYDQGEFVKSSSVEVYIKVLDMNDNAPIVNLNQPPGGTVLSEKSEIGSFVSHLNIEDKDSNKNGRVVCNVLDDSFTIVSAGIVNHYKIVLNKTLDHDTKPFHNVSILCQDSGDLPQRTFAHIIVNVEDVNDNSPKFTEDVYRAVINENNEKDASVLQVTAIDIDSGKFGEVTYSIHNDLSGLFKINTFSGLVIASVPLDREIHGDEIIFRVTAKDNGEPALTSTGTVVVRIQDLNDNDPVFAANPLKFFVSENVTEGWGVGNISVSDPDIGPNGTVRLKFPDDPSVLEFFSFHESGVIKTYKRLDREVIAFHEFQVQAIDMGGRTSAAQVIIYITDINDNAPEIIYPNEYDDTLSIPYSLAVGSKVLQIEARDYDNGENAELYYFIEQDNASYAFSLNVKSGNLFLNRSLHEVDIGQKFHFYFRVKDGGSPSIQTWTELNIYVIRGSPEPLVQEVMSANLWIVVSIVIVTAILSVVMIIFIVKICWFNRRKGKKGNRNSDLSSKEIDPHLIDSASSSSSTSRDSEKVPEIGINIQDGYQKGYFDNIDKSDYSPRPSVDQDNMYMEQVKQLDLELHKRLDETTSDNSGELGTRDSGQGGSDVDNISLNDLQHVDSPDSAIDTPRDIFQLSFGSHHSSTQHGPLSNSFRSNTPHDQSSERMVPIQTANFSQIPAKTAERKELSKLRKSQKRVMFSDDLENSHSSGRSSTMSDPSYPDNYLNNGPLSPRRYQRAFSEDTPDRLSRADDWLRRSADSLSWQQNKEIYNQLPSNQIKSKDFRNKPMGDNIKGYLDKVMARKRSCSLSDNHSQENSQGHSKDSTNVFTVTGRGSQRSGSGLRKSGSLDTDSVLTFGQESTTTSGSYHLGSPAQTYSLSSPGSEFENVFSNEFDI